MNVQSPYFPPGAVSSVNAGLVLNPALMQTPDGQTSPYVAGRSGDQLMSQFRGKYGAMAARGGVFMASVGTAAVAIPINTTTNANTFAISNAVGSGKIVELIRFKLDFLHTNAAPATANVIGFSFVPLATNAESAPTNIPDPFNAGGHNVLLGGAAPTCKVRSALTYASALTVAANWGIPMFSFPASWVPTVGGYPVPLIYDFDGAVLVPPGFSLTLTASTAWGATTVVPSMTWAETLI